MFVDVRMERLAPVSFAHPKADWKIDTFAIDSRDLMTYGITEVIKESELARADFIDILANVNVIAMRRTGEREGCIFEQVGFFEKWAAKWRLWRCARE
jgi:hypothetical protein